MILSSPSLSLLNKHHRRQYCHRHRAQHCKSSHYCFAAECALRRRASSELCSGTITIFIIIIMAVVRQVITTGLCAVYDVIFSPRTAAKRGPRGASPSEAKPGRKHDLKWPFTRLNFSSDSVSRCLLCVTLALSVFHTEDADHTSPSSLTRNLEDQLLLA